MHLEVQVRAGGPAGVADPGSELIILEVDQPTNVHQGGTLAFGSDGYLYISLGDGGPLGDPDGNAQNTGVLLGSILRVDVSDASEAEPYSIPPDNPFVGSVGGAREEIWAYGLRNPWRFSFDPATGDMWAGDVGQDRYEEIDLIAPGGNYGWNTLEGTHCFNPRTACEGTGTVLPVVEYGTADGCSVIGGYVYRGPNAPWLQGIYLYGDYCSGEVWGIRHDNGRVAAHQKLADTDFRITSFGQDLEGNLYVLTQDSGVYRVVP